MAKPYKTPGVYIEEVSTLAPSVVPISTAVPAFLGYTRKRPDEKAPSIRRITSLIDFKKYFGEGYQPNAEITVSASQPLKIRIGPIKSVMFYALEHYFKNGGGDCYIVSVGTFDGAGNLLQKKADYIKGLTALELEEEPTLIVLTDATALGSVDYAELVVRALAQCHTLQSRFTIMDVISPMAAPIRDQIAGFRNSISSDYLDYGAAYFPWLKTLIPISFDEEKVLLKGANLPKPYVLEWSGPGKKGLEIQAVGKGKRVGIVVNGKLTKDIDFEMGAEILVIKVKTEKNAKEVADGFAEWIGKKKGIFSLTAKGDGSEKVTPSKQAENTFVATEYAAELKVGEKLALKIFHPKEKQKVELKMATDTKFTVEDKDGTLILTVPAGAKASAVKAAFSKQTIKESQFRMEVLGAEQKFAAAIPATELNPSCLKVNVGGANGLKATGGGKATTLAIVGTDEPGTCKVEIAGEDKISISLASNVDCNAILKEFENTEDKKGFALEKSGDGSATLAHLLAREINVPATNIPKDTLERAAQYNSGLYFQLLKALKKETITLPPSAAMAGIYARVDVDRGVWKAPANVSVSSTIRPVIKINADEQENMNVDSISGKSVNAIRQFTGQGTLVWGARTMKGNDNEWRYVPVRRLFIFIEQSLKRATEFAVFEPNVPDTWGKVSSMADSFLRGLWQDGALAGATPEQAYFIQIGEGITMTKDDILEGRMIVKIGLAAVRPAEFVILSFSHFIQKG